MRACRGIPKSLPHESNLARQAMNHLHIHCNFSWFRKLRMFAWASPSLFRASAAQQLVNERGKRGENCVGDIVSDLAQCLGYSNCVVPFRDMVLEGKETGCLAMDLHLW